MSGFCTDCGCRIPSFEGLQCCPKCHSTSVPCDDMDQVTININWHELRILAIWAENWGLKNDLGNVVYRIARRIEDQHPDRALDCPLTLAGELRALKDEHVIEIFDDKLSDAVDNFKRLDEPPDE